MEPRSTTYADRVTAGHVFDDDADRAVEERLNTLLSINAETARTNQLYRSEGERLAAETMVNPLSTERAFQLFGLMLGSLPPAAIFLSLLSDMNLPPNKAWIVVLMVLANVTAAVVGYHSGRLVGRSVSAMNEMRLSTSLLLLPFVGILWGVVAGAAGGVFFFVIGAFFGAFLGGTVGAAALPAFAVLHRWVKSGDMIELRHFLPLAFGVVLTICAFILGL